MHLGRDLLDLLEGEDGVDGEGLPLVPGEGPTAAVPLSSPANHSLKYNTRSKPWKIRLPLLIGTP